MQAQRAAREFEVTSTVLKLTSTMILGALLLAGCGKAGQEPASAVAFLMPDQNSTRYEQHDYPGFAARMKALCADCRVIYQNADGDVAKQQQQFNAAIAQGAKVVVLNPVDSSAAASWVALAQQQGVKVVAYDRPIPNAKAAYYVSFDNQALGKAIAESLVSHLKAGNVPTATGGLLQINGSPTDAAAGLIKKGIHEGLDRSGYRLLAEFDTPNWDPPKAQQWASGQVTRFGSQIIGVAAANDGTAGGAIAALKAAGLTPLPPVTGNDATLAALQLVVAGDQYNTISKPSEIVATAAANVAVQLIRGEAPAAKTTLYGTPSELFVPTVVTAQNLKAEIIDKNIATAEAICVGRSLEGCRRLGIVAAAPPANRP